MQLQTANRQQSVIKLALQGPSGSGKTYSSLLLAHGLVGNWNQIAVIDTENNSSHLYSHLGNFNVLSLSEPFSPERYIEAIETCEKAGLRVIIIDSISQEWEGSGGIIETHGNMAGNSFTNWNKVTPRHNSFVQKMLQSSSHIIATIRSKQDYVPTDKNGKMVPEKVGLKGVTRDGMDYEFTVVLDLDITDQTGSKIKTWCLGEDLIKNIEIQINDVKTVQELRNILIKYPTLRSKIEPLCVNRKAQIEGIVTDQIVKPQNIE